MSASPRARRCRRVEKGWRAAHFAAARDLLTSMPAAVPLTFSPPLPRQSMRRACTLPLPAATQLAPSSAALGTTQPSRSFATSVGGPTGWRRNPAGSCRLRTAAMLLQRRRNGKGRLGVAIRESRGILQRPAVGGRRALSVCAQISKF